MAGAAADRKGGRPPTQALPYRVLRLFGSDSTEPAANFLFSRALHANRYRPGSKRGAGFRWKTVAKFAQTGRMSQ